MFILYTQLIFATHMGGFSEPKQPEGYFRTMAECNQRGKELFIAPRNDDMVRQWECQPETSGINK